VRREVLQLKPILWIYDFYESFVGFILRGPRASFKTGFWDCGKNLLLA
jgi:hypothetical protein